MPLIQTSELKILILMRLLCRLFTATKAPMIAKVILKNGNGKMIEQKMPEELRKLQLQMLEFINFALNFI